MLRPGLLHRTQASHRHLIRDRTPLPTEPRDLVQDERGRCHLDATATADPGEHVAQVSEAVTANKQLVVGITSDKHGVEDRGDGSQPLLKRLLSQARSQSHPDNRLDRGSRRHGHSCECSAVAGSPLIP